MTKPSKKRTAKREDAHTEPETLTEASVGGDAMSLDSLVVWLRREPAASMTLLHTAVDLVYGVILDPAGELALLGRLKADGRFRVETQGSGKRRVNVVALTEAAAGIISQNNPAAKSKESEPQPTLGDLVEAQQGKPQRITWPHNIGSSVMLMTAGHPSRKATIRNIADHGGYCLYDLAVDTGTIDGVPADRIGRDLDAEGELSQLREHLALLQRHNDRAKELAQKHVEMEAEDRRLADVHAEHRKRMREVAAQLAQHVRSDPGQTDLRDVVGDGSEGPSRGAKMASEPSAAEDKLADDTAPLPLEDLPFTLEELNAAAYNQATASIGKPQKVKPVSVDGVDHVCTDVQDGVATLLPVITRPEWDDAGHLQDFGEPRATESELPSERMILGGPLCGVPVRVGRGLRFIGPLREALLVRLPPKQMADEPEVVAVGKDAAAGD